MYPDPQRLEDVSKIRDAMRQISQEASVAVDLLDREADYRASPKKLEDEAH
jgi:hypothetical protein